MNLQINLLHHQPGMCKFSLAFFRLLLVILLVTGSILGFSQDYVADTLGHKKLEPDWPQNIDIIVKTNPLGPLAGSVFLTSEYLLSLEFVTSSFQSSQISVSYMGKSPILKSLEDSIPDLELLIVRGYRIQISHRFYMLKKQHYAPLGFYLSPHTSFTGIKVSTRYQNSMDNYIRISHFNMNLLAGFQLIINEDQVIDMYMGLGYKNNFWEEHQSQTTISINADDLWPWYYNPIKFTIGFKVGIGF